MSMSTLMITITCGHECQALLDALMEYRNTHNDEYNLCKDVAGMTNEMRRRCGYTEGGKAFYENRAKEHYARVYYADTWLHEVREHLEKEYPEQNELPFN